MLLTQCIWGIRHGVPTLPVNGFKQIALRIGAAKLVRCALASPYRIDKPRAAGWLAAAGWRPG